MQPIKFTISGLRGVWGENLNEEIAREYIQSFFLFLQKRNATKILVSRDARTSGPAILHIIKEIGKTSGIDIVDIGISPTPTLIFLIKREQYDGGIMISASHNPKEYNGIKFLTDKGLYANQTEVDEIKTLLGKNLDEKHNGTYRQDDTLPEKHIEHILQFVDVENIRSKKFRVVLDPINSCGYKLGAHILEELGCTPIIINGIPNGEFAHVPEPLPENLTKLGETVELFKAHVGFAMDPDADRLVVCDNTGKVIFEEYTLSLAIQAVLNKHKTDIVINLSTSNTNEDLAFNAGMKTYRTPVGEAHVVAGIQKYQALIGGEGGGGVIHREINACRDSLTGIALILELLAQEAETLEEIVAKLPKWEFIKTKFPFSGDFNVLKEKTMLLFPDATSDTQDGVRFDFPDRSWVQIRASNTEPIIRIFAEGKNRNEMNERIEKIKDLLH